MLRSNINGELHHVVPGRLLLFPPPADSLPPGQQWADDDGRRSFGPGFYADLFAHLGVAAVLRLDPPAATDPPAAFAAAGIPVLDVTTRAAAAVGSDAGADAAGQPPSLAMLDRLVALMDAAPGLVALQLRAGDDGARALVAAYIARRCQPPTPPCSPTGRRRRSGPALSGGGGGGMEAREAMAWLHMAWPCPVSGWRCAKEEQ